MAKNQLTKEEALQKYEEARKLAMEMTTDMMMDGVAPDVVHTAAGLLFITGCQVFGLDPMEQFQQLMKITGMINRLNEVS